MAETLMRLQANICQEFKERRHAFLFVCFCFPFFFFSFFFLDWQLYTFKHSYQVLNGLLDHEARYGFNGPWKASLQVKSCKTALPNWVSEYVGDSSDVEHEPQYKAYTITLLGLSRKSDGLTWNPVTQEFQTMKGPCWVLHLQKTFLWQYLT